MGRIRTIKPEFWTDEDLASVSECACLLAIGLLNHADDEGYFRANPALIRAAVFPLREPSVSIHGMLSELSDMGFVRLFEGADGKQYGEIINFLEHQRINRPTPSKIRGLCRLTEDSVSPHGGLAAGKERKGREGKGDKPPVSPLPDRPKTKAAQTRAVEEPPDLSGVDPQAWAEYDAYRRSKPKLRSGWSAIAQAKAANLLRPLKPQEQRDVVDYSIVGGYTGLFPDRVNRSEASKRPSQGSAGERHAAVLEFLDQKMRGVT